jgi:hypothetical protein
VGEGEGARPPGSTGVGQHRWGWGGAGLLGQAASWSTGLLALWAKKNMHSTIRVPDGLPAGKK